MIRARHGASDSCVEPPKPARTGDRIGTQNPSTRERDEIIVGHKEMVPVRSEAQRSADPTLRVICQPEECSGCCF